MNLFDLRHVLRRLLRAPGFSALSILLLGLAFGGKLLLAQAGLGRAFRHADLPGLAERLLGEGAQLFRDAICQAGDPLYLTPPHIVISRAANVALLGCELLHQGHTHDPMTLEPLYIRRSEAEVLWEQRQGQQT